MEKLEGKSVEDQIEFWNKATEEMIRRRESMKKLDRPSQ